jgi:LacI family transcriptional regulator
MSGITAKDLAKKLGLSAAAVSMALNGKPGVSEKTREIVLAEAIRHGYLPSKSREQILPTGKTICFMIYYEQSGVAEQTSFSTFVLKGVEMGAKKYGYKTLFTYYHADQPFETQINDTVSHGVSGIIILGTDMTEMRKDAITEFMSKSIRVPVVIVDNFIFASYVDCVGNDNIFGAKSAISYLIDQGHRKIGYLRSKQRITNYEDREIGIRLALGEHPELTLAPLQVVDVDIASEKAYADICAWLKEKPELPDAFFAENDVVAAASIRAFKAWGIRVPDDVSVIGFDDIPICDMMEPSITTMRSFKEKLGEIAVDLLQDRILAGDTVQTARENGLLKISLSTQLKERSSVKRK